MEISFTLNFSEKRRQEKSPNAIWNGSHKKLIQKNLQTLFGSKASPEEPFSDGWSWWNGKAHSGFFKKLWWQTDINFRRISKVREQLIDQQIQTRATGRQRLGDSRSYLIERLIPAETTNFEKTKILWPSPRLGTKTQNFGKNLFLNSLLGNRLTTKK